MIEQIEQLKAIREQADQRLRRSPDYLIIHHLTKLIDELSHIEAHAHQNPASENTDSYQHEAASARKIAEPVMTQEEEEPAQYHQAMKQMAALAAKMQESQQKSIENEARKVVDLNLNSQLNQDAHADISQFEAQIHQEIDQEESLSSMLQRISMRLSEAS